MGRCRLRLRRIRSDDSDSSGSLPLATTVVEEDSWLVDSTVLGIHASRSSFEAI
jgi:hypothetical protein